MNTLSFPASLSIVDLHAPLVRVRELFKTGKFPMELEAAEGSFTAFLLARLFSAAPGVFLVVTPTEREAEDLAGDLESLGTPAAILPWWGTMAYREMAPLSTVFGERTRVLSDLALGRPGIVLVPERAFLTPLPPASYIRDLLIQVKTGDTIDTPAMARTLVSYGYTRVPRVQVHGEFALRGEVFDILMGGDEAAVRILFDFDKVESIRFFDPVDQTTIAPDGRERPGYQRPNEGLVIRPLKEVVWTDDRILALSRLLEGAEEFADNGKACLEDLMTRRTTAGEELLFPLAFEDGGAALTDYLDGGAVVFFLDRERLENAQGTLEREYGGLYRQARGGGGAADSGREVPVPSRILLRFDDLAKRVERRVSFMSIRGGGKDSDARLSLGCDPPRSFFGNINYLNEEFGNLLTQGWQLVVAAESEMQAARIRELFRDREVLMTGKAAPPAPAVEALPLSSGFALPGVKLMVVQENEIFGRRKRAPRSLRQVKSAAIDTFVELNPGDYVVHVNYGIGLFKGIERIRALGHERDYVKIEYLGDEVVFVPIEQVNMVQRYIGSEGAPPRLDKLGSKNWENRKNRVSRSVEDIAQRLVTLYSKRKAAQGFAFPKDTEWQTMVEAAFPFEETADQLRCVEEIKEDMESPHPMD
ncbi:MAG: transcription-repair coupling factor, partial [Spirochaetaceae bacterium]|nr:transcription-repair coupling factor [Spirochaetaceae bacterium]